MIELRRRYSGGKGSGSPSFSRLPAGYQEVEWLVLNTEQGFDTQIPYDDSLNYKCKMRFKIGSHYEQFASPFAAYKGNSYNSFRILIDYINNECYVWANTVSAYPNSTYKTIVDKEFIDIEFSQEECIINDVSVPLESTIRGEPTDNTYFSVGRYSVGAAYRYFSGFIGSIQLSVINQDIAHLIPCYRISDRKPGMYDIVNDVFYTNAGTGEFLVGPDVHYNIPFEYQQVEYLESTGEQYIILPYYYVPTTDTISFKLNFAKIANWSTPLGYYGSRISGDAQLFRLQNQEGKLSASYGSLAKNAETGLTLASIGIQYASFDAGKGFCLNGEYYGLYDKYIIGDETNTPILFGYRIIGDISTSGEIRKSPAVIYSYTHNRDNTCLLDFIPCYRKADNVAGMYDIVNGVFYTNAGTGSFIVGPDVI